MFDVAIDETLDCCSLKWMFNVWDKYWWNSLSMQIKCCSIEDCMMFLSAWFLDNAYLPGFRLAVKLKPLRTKQQNEMDLHS